MPAARIASLMTNLTTADLVLLTSPERLRFAQMCDRWAKAARDMEAQRIVDDARSATRDSGVLSDLRRGLRSE